MNKYSTWTIAEMNEGHRYIVKVVAKYVSLQIKN